MFGATTVTLMCYFLFSIKICRVGHPFSIHKMGTKNNKQILKKYKMNQNTKNSVKKKSDNVFGKNERRHENSTK